LSYAFIYFDLDDTLLDHKSAEVSALKDVYSEFPMFQELPHEKLVDVYGTVNSRQWKLYSNGKVSREELQRNRFELTLKELDLDCSLYREVGSFYLACYRNHWRWVEGAEEVYRDIARNFSVGILTNGFSETQKLKFKKFELHTSADHLVISEDVGALKPDPKVFEHATELAGVAPDEILYVGDSFSSDIKGGAACGWNTAWYTQNGESENCEQADFVFDDFTTLGNMLDI
jgi:putative hydrolase of the HAD superfamily